METLKTLKAIYSILNQPANRRPFGDHDEPLTDEQKRLAIVLGDVKVAREWLKEAIDGLEAAENRKAI